MPVFFCGYIMMMKYKEGVLKRWLFILLMIVVAAIAFIVPRTFGYHGFSYGLINIFYVSIPFSLAVVVYYAFDRNRLMKEKYQLEQQNLRNELAILKNQINPHFLFNTLNNIDSLIKSNADKASVALIELSDMMRYMLYETDTDKVFLKHEIAYIENYLKLQSMQYANPDLVKYELQGDVGLKRIAPMLFIPFIENAFKHCTDKNVKHAIRFSFAIEDRTIKFEAININDKDKVISKDKSGGAGLDIVKRRLELLYPHSFDLRIDDNNNLFSVMLVIRYGN